MSHIDFDIVSDFGTCPEQGRRIRISSLCYINSTNSYVRIYKQIMQNKANFRNDKMNINLDMTSKYKILSAGSGQKTKPIQTQFKANLSQNKPNLSQNKANSNPIQTQFVERAKMIQSDYLQRIMNKNAAMGQKKQTQNKANLIPLVIHYRQTEDYCGLPFQVAVSKLISLVFRLSFGLARDIGRLKKRWCGWFHAAVAIDVSLSSLLISLVALCQIANILQFSVVPLHSQCFKKQSSNNGPPSMASKSSSKLTSSGPLAKIYPFFLPVTALTKFALTSCWNILERYSAGIPSALAIVAVVAGNCVLCLTIYINACKA